ncbi:MAG: ChbG/HpnK family deacetylase [Lachnospiraceae bacterium]|jgi:predicted glycoside hydrolase/deacetylase ChbG (UPF0249 family)|nr:ChbG/HpnK family deacetylase [Lachnospiraceae bacterium]
MKLVIRGDDVGYSKVCNIGSFEAIENGVVTSADVMLDTPGSVDALERLRSYPWISIGWHTHFWGSPVLGGDKVPSLFDAERGGFRKDLSAEDVVFEEALAECRAEAELCIKILGRAPDVGGSISVLPDSPFGHALRKIHDEYHIAYHFMGIDPVVRGFEFKADDKWAGRKIFVRGIFDYCKPLKAEPLTEAGWTDSISALEKYDPIRFYTEDESGLLKVPEDSITVHAWHPGYVDYYVYRQGDYSPAASCFKDIRTVDVHALCSQEIKDWLTENHVELINMRDALYGTSEYQNYLKTMKTLK